jgi:Na+/H+-dicarboxylate symporter
MAHRNTNILTILILLGLVAGALVGEYGLHDPTGANVDQLQWLKEVGNIVLIRPLKVLIIPLILFSVISGITRIGDPAKLGIVGIATLVYYLATMFTAVTLGACLVTWIAPGVLPSDVQLTLIETSQATAAM